MKEIFRVLKVGGHGVVSFDVLITHLDENKVFHKDSLKNLKQLIKELGGSSVYTGGQETRLDETPLKHQHEFHKIIFRKK